MSEEPANDRSPAHEDPRNALSYRMARAAVIILGVLLVIALGLLVVGLGWKMSGGRGEAEAAKPVTFTLTPGAHIVSMETQPGRLILRTRSAAGDEIDIIDTDNGHLVGQVTSPGRETK